MLNPARKTLMMLGAFGALAVGGSAIAGAASNGSSSGATGSAGAAKSSTDPGPGRPMQEQLTGDTADKVKAAALDKVPGGTVLRAESGGHGGAAYHVHVRKSDGTEVVVLVDKDFKATSVETKPAGGRGGPGGPGHRGGPGGRGGRSDEKALTGDTADKVTAAAKAKYPGATVLRVETDADHGSPYEAHVRKADGTEVEILINKDFKVTDTNEMGKRP